MINEHTVKKSKINFIIEKHPEVFKTHYDAEYLVLIIFIFYELHKDTHSFWHPYFQIVNISDLPMLWEDHEIEEMQD